MNTTIRKRNIPVIDSFGKRKIFLEPHLFAHWKRRKLMSNPSNCSLNSVVERKDDLDLSDDKLKEVMSRYKDDGSSSSSSEDRSKEYDDFYDIERIVSDGRIPGQIDQLKKYYNKIILPDGSLQWKLKKPWVVDQDSISNLRELRSQIYDLSSDEISRSLNPDRTKLDLLYVINRFEKERKKLRQREFEDWDFRGIPRFFLQRRLSKF